MGAELYRQEPVFAEALDQCLAAIQPLLGSDLRSLLLTSHDDDAVSQETLKQTRFAQPALFAIEYALARLWMSWGVQPSALIGHSVGEYVAGCLAGVFSLEDALMLVGRRAALVQAQPPGAMLAVRLPEKDLRELLGETLSIAASNAPSLSVASGPFEAIGVLEETLASRKIATKRLPTSHAFHSAMMDPVIAPFTALLREVRLSAPKIPYVSNVLAEWITEQQATDPAYWAGHVRQTVRFSDSVAKALENSQPILLEVGPGQSLSQLVRQQPALPRDAIATWTLSGPKENEGLSVANAIARLWTAGVPFDWRAYHAGARRRRVPLPTYPFQRKRFWPEPGVGAPCDAVSTVARAPQRETLEVMAETADRHESVKGSNGALAGHPAESRMDHLAQLIRTSLTEASGADLQHASETATFLELGFDSLLLTQAANRFQKRFGVPITFRQLMGDLSSVRSLAAHIDSQLPAGRFQPADQGAGPPSAPVSRAMNTASAGASHGPFRPPSQSSAMTALSPTQAEALGRWTRRYTDRTAGSKKLAAQNRPSLADPRSVSGFSPLWKEMVYPLYTERSEGATVWDVDGNEYLDFVMGFGASLFGHRPAFVMEAVERQLKLGFEIGPIQPLVGEVALLACELTGMERVAFCNTGSEAVLAAMRVARTVTGRDVIAGFSGAYHGVFDEVLARPATQGGEMRSTPIAPGIPESAVSQMRVFNWGDPESLELIRRQGHELAAVLVEPIQSRRLDLQPAEFLRELRRITEDCGIALIFDEMVTGFRFHPGGAQAWYGIRADIATYGKVLGGGFPIGMVGGSSRYMDALDGGAWQFGDDSRPDVGMTFFAGTFVRHPVALTAARAVLARLKSEGPRLQDQVADLAARAATGLRDLAARHQAPLRVAQASSILYLTVSPELHHGGLLFYLLRTRGIHAWENRAFVFTTAHTTAHVDQLLRAVDESLAELREGGFLPELAAPTPVATKEASPAAPAVSANGSEPRRPGGGLALTDAQREMWLAAVMDERASRSYNNTFLIHLSGPLNEAALQASLQACLDRHDSLRARFDLKSPVQRIASEARLPWARVDLSALAADARSRALKCLGREQSEAAFDLSRAPLLRAQLVVCGAQENALVLTISHLVADGWSLGVLFSELKSLYAARVLGIADGLETALQFEGYAALTQSARFREAAARSEAYWKRIYAELPAALELPVDRMRRTPRSFGASRVSVAWEAAFVRALRESSARRGATLLVSLLAGFNILLRRLSGQDDIVVGIPASGQSSPALADTPGIGSLVGHCVQLLPVRSRLSADAPFESFLRSTQDAMLDAFEHQDLTFGRLLECLNVPREAERVPLAPVMFNLDRAPEGFELSGTRTRVEDVPHATQVFDLSLNIVDRGETLTLDCDFNTDAFDAGTVTRWLGYFRALLESAIADPAQPIGRMEILSPADRSRILVEWNETRVPLPTATTTHALFSEQARKSPEAIAVEFGDKRLTYAELDQRTDAFAARLQSMGVGADCLVGIYLQRSELLVVAALGILKAGGAYVPLDPDFPRERLGWMVEDARLKVLVTERSLLGDLPPHAARCVCLDKEDLSRGAPTPTAGPDNLAYVIFTSGSTGRPKGVQVLHRGVVNFLNSMRKTPGIRPQDVLLSVTTLSFDISGLELYLPLICGAKVVVATRETAADGEKLAAEITRRGVTFLQATPTTWRLLLAAGWQGSPGMKILCGGEAFPPDLAAQLAPLCGSLWNMYGPTETTIWSTCCQLSSSDAAITIGRPIDNTTLYIVDKQLQPVPIGVPGELLIGGAGLARGYLDRPEMTAEKFIQNPFSADPDARVYRTGDLARWREDGHVICLGRQDHQVKVRGYRIELGDIEAAISRQQGVGACAVIVREDQPGDKRLVAYLESSGPEAFDLSVVRVAVRELLPDYMNPQHWVVLPKLPLTPNAKIDRRALPSPTSNSGLGGASQEPPATDTERKLAELWQRVLHLESVGRGSSFFELGGHSLLTVRLFAEIERTWGCRLPLATILRAETLQALAAEIDVGSDASRPWTSLVTIRSTGNRPPFFCAHGGGGEVLFGRDLARCLAPDQPFYGLQARGLQGDHARDTSIDSMAEHYIEEVLRVQSSGPFYLGGFCMGGVIAYEMARQLIAQGHTVGLIVMIGTYNPVEAIRSVDSVGSLEVWRQKLVFHWANWSALPVGERGTYLSHRFKAMVDGRLKRLAGRVSQITRHLGSTRNGVVHELLEDYNDKLGMKYQPEPMDVDVLLVRPQKNFTFWSDPHLGWRGVVRGHLELTSVPANPGGMLVEPYVSQVGEAIALALVKAQSGSPTPRP
ncbi:MAG: amino acid adenylation domain-containing protein, partial [Verrucomicrobia bacterium]|nr:amino acid adenylation domain-containing protein [Verrucomicrobiota bacterium]